MQDQLTDLEIAKVEAFCKDEAMYDAVVKVLLAGIYTHGTVQKDKKPTDPLVNGAFSLVHLASANPVSDEILGAHLRGVWEGINALKNATQRLKEIKSKVEAVESPYNEAI